MLPELFCLARSKDAAVAEHLQLTSDSLQWNIDFIRAAQDYEVVFFTMFFNMLGGEILCWAKSFYNVRTYYESDSFPWRSIWRSKVPQELCSLLGQKL